MSFYLGNFMACFVPGTDNRRKVRSRMVQFGYNGRIRRFIRKKFGEKVTSIVHVRQITLNRVVFLVNNKYFVKIFRNVSNRRLKDQVKLLEHVGPMLSVDMPRVIVDDRWPMYATERIVGRHIYDFDPKVILKNKDKIKNRVIEIIDELQSIDVTKIPNYEKYLTSMQFRRWEEAGPQKQVLAHFDLNESNLFFDDNMNISVILDWDTLSIANNPETDMHIFMRYWPQFINSL